MEKNETGYFQEDSLKRKSVENLFYSPPQKRKRKRKLQTPLVPLTIFEVCVAHMNNDLNASDEQATGT